MWFIILLAIVSFGSIVYGIIIAIDSAKRRSGIGE